MHKFRSILILVTLTAVTGCAGKTAKTTPAHEGTNLEARVARRFEALRATPPEQRAFLRLMPKGGDLHTHLSGAVYAESFIAAAAETGLCVTLRGSVLGPPPCQAPGQRPAVEALNDTAFYRQLIDAWSMRNYELSGQSGHDHFFDTFAKFGAASTGRTGEMLAEVVSRAAAGRVSYVEAMITPDGGVAARLGNELTWNGDLAAARAALDAKGLSAAVPQTIERLRAAEARKNEILRCGTPQADDGCQVTLRYLYQVIRTGSLGAVFAQLTLGLALADQPGSPVVGLNMVAPEDDPVAMRNFSAHMQMLKFLRPFYPRAHLTLHAGELVQGLVPPDGLRFHIRDSVNVAGAERIGHGVDIMLEDGARSLLQQMAERRVMVEICLTSNDGILGIRGADHPLATYLKYGVPVALATDDEGVSRSEMTVEYLRAAQDQRLTYPQLKTMARTSLEFAFVAGASLWRERGRFDRPVAACTGERPGPGAPSTTCEQFLASSDKARLQWALERDFAAFERVEGAEGQR